MTHVPVQDQDDHGQKNTLQNAAFYILLGFTLLLPLFFIPSSIVSFQFSKSLFIGLIAVIALALYLISVLKNGSIRYPKSKLLWVVPGVLVTYLLAALFSEMPLSSLIGYGFEISTFSFVLILFVIMVLVAQLFTKKDRIFYTYLAYFVAFFLLALFHFLRFIFGADFLSFGFFPSLVSNTIGKWSDVAVFFGAGAILSLVTLEEVKLTKTFRILLQVALYTALVILAVVNFTVIWYVLAVFSLIYFVYAISTSRAQVERDDVVRESEHTEEVNEEHTPQGVSSFDSKNPMRHVSANALVVLVVSILFILAGSQIGGVISQFLNTANIDVRPSWVSTYEVAEQTLAENPFFGSGPNRFLSQWLTFKPEGVNQSAFWNTNFNFGIGLIPTFFVTSGVVGAIGWLAFLGAFVYLGFRMLFVRTKNVLTRYLITSSFLVSLFFWIMSVVYVPSSVIFTLTFIFTGLFGASLYIENLIPQERISFFKYPRASFVTVLGMVLLLIASVSFGYLVTQKAVASMYYQRGGQALAENDLNTAAQSMQQAITLGSGDLYYRGLAQVYMTRANQVVAERSGEQLNNTEAQEFQQAYQAAVQSAQRATQQDPTNYQNWRALGEIYRQAVVYGVQGAYEQSKQAYNRALEENPRSPSLNLQLARLEIANDNLEDARGFIDTATNLKANYTEAIFLSAQIAATQGNTEEAIQRTVAATRTAPNDPGLHFQLGLLQYNAENYNEAAGAFERAVRIQPRYANAKYFLGLSYWQADQSDAAVAQFEDLTELAPDNEQVANILADLRAGRDPFGGETPSAEEPAAENDDVTSQDELPVEEQTDQE